MKINRIKIGDIEGIAIFELLETYVPPETIDEIDELCGDDFESIFYNWSHLYGIGICEKWMEPFNVEDTVSLKELAILAQYLCNNFIEYIKTEWSQ